MEKKDIHIYNENCFDTLTRFITGVRPNIILTSPPYNTSPLYRTERAMKNHEQRYDVHLDNLSDKEYHDFTLSLFNNFNKTLQPNGVILYNLSYGSNNESMWEALEAIREADFTIADTIVWKKKSALPNNTSPNKLTRITEFIFVICRKTEYNSFQSNKTVASISNNGQRFYENIFNFIEAPNNDGPNKLNKATYSSELVKKLLSIYARDNDVIYDPFMGTGTTAIGCLKYNRNLQCYGSELSTAQCQFADERINSFLNDNATLF